MVVSFFILVTSTEQSGLKSSVQFSSLLIKVLCQVHSSKTNKYITSLSPFSYPIKSKPTINNKAQDCLVLMLHSTTRPCFEDTFPT